MNHDVISATTLSDEDRKKREVKERMLEEYFAALSSESEFTFFLVDILRYILQ